MKRITLFAALVFLAPVFLFALPGNQRLIHQAANIQAVEDEIKQIEQEMLDALLKGEPSANEKCMAENFIFTGPDGMIGDKKQAMADIKSGDLKFESSKMDDFKVTMLGNTAIATYRTTDKGTYKGKDLSGQYRWTDTFVKDNGKWKLLAGQGTPLHQ